MNHTVNITYKGIDLTVEGTYDKGDEEIRYTSDMGGYPGFPSSFDIECVWVNGVDIYELVSSRGLEEIERIIVEKLEN